jgi:hypothetical protein
MELYPQGKKKVLFQEKIKGRKIPFQITFPQVTEQADHSPRIYLPGIGQG